MLDGSSTSAKRPHIKRMTSAFTALLLRMSAGSVCLLRAIARGCCVPVARE